MPRSIGCVPRALPRPPRSRHAWRRKGSSVLQRHNRRSVEVNSETDFVARNEKFQAMVSEIAKIALNTGANLEKLKTAKYPGSKHAVAEYVAEMVATIGENMTVRRAALLGKDGVVGTYMHNQIAPGLGKIGVIVALESTGNQEELKAFGRMLAMHVAATNPVALDLAGVPPIRWRAKRQFSKRRMPESRPMSWKRSLPAGSSPMPRRTACSSRCTSMTAPRR